MHRPAYDRALALSARTREQTHLTTGESRLVASDDVGRDRPVLIGEA